MTLKCQAYPHMWVCCRALHHLQWSALQAEARWRWSCYPLLIILKHPHICFPALQSCSLFCKCYSGFHNPPRDTRLFLDPLECEILKTAALCFISSQCKHSMISLLCCKPTLLFGSPMRSCLTQPKQRQSTQKYFLILPIKKYSLFFDSFHCSFRRHL